MENARSTLMAYFQWNTDHPDEEPKRLYSEFPKYFTWNAQTRTWRPRKKGQAIGRINHVNPMAGEKFYLRLLLTVERGAKSYKALYEHEGVCYPTYRTACVARGLVDDDREWIHCFDEAISFSTGTSLRILFLTALKNRGIADPSTIWERYNTSFCDDLL